ncbi:uncharacterized protein BDW70DRAFT_168545 [Aspergillus foveolatus]|uniref:uncharacterized protein n=1 Tax=Aspergillus foveolatus TaxID=210207 RepID=UPI003CCCC053
MKTSMILRLLLYLIFFIPFPIIIIVFIFFYQRFCLPITKATVFKTAPECRAVIEASQFPDSRKNQLTQYEARAWPNQTLQRAFGIQNAFTTGNVTDAKKFVSKTHRLIRASAVDWHGLSKTLSSMVQDMNWALADNDMSVSGGIQVKVTLAPMVRALALRASLSVFFEMREGATIENRHLVDLGTIIHRTWMDMKCGSEKVMEQTLNLILPSFETLWRIVLRLFIVLHNRRDYKQVFLEFIQKPTPTQFKLELGKEQISAEFLVKEALRLYPPTRRIRRAWLFAGSKSNRIIAADVEASQLDTKVWGADALQFNPARWRQTSTSIVENRNLLAFGSRPFLCPASHGFGPMVIGLLVGILLSVAGDGYGGKWVLGSDDVADVEEIQSGRRLRNDRGAYERVFLGRPTQDRTIDSLSR